jgi:hypothetical protein
LRLGPLPAERRPHTHPEALPSRDAAAGGRATRDFRASPRGRSRRPRRLCAIDGSDRRSRGRAHKRQDASSDRRLHRQRRRPRGSRYPTPSSRRLTNTRSRLMCASRRRSPRASKPGSMSTRAASRRRRECERRTNRRGQAARGKARANATPRRPASPAAPPGFQPAAAFL